MQLLLNIIKLPTRWCTGWHKFNVTEILDNHFVYHCKLDRIDVRFFFNRETIQQLLEYQSECAIRSRISAIFGLHRINDAFEYYTTVPSGKVLIDVKDCDRLTLCDKF